MKHFVFGTANLNQKYGIKKKKINQKHIKAILKEKKIKYLDTSFEYQINNSLIKKFNFKNIKIITKVKLPYYAQKKFLENFENNLKNNLVAFKKKKFEAILLHNVNDLKKKNGRKLFFILKNLQKKKLVKRIGVSIYKPNDLKLVFKIFIPEIVQFPLNIFNQNFINHKYFRYLSSKKTIFQARSIFLQGMITEKLSNLKHYKISKNLFSKIKELNIFCKKNKISRLEACIYFIKSIKGIKLITFGINNKFELKEILKKFKKKKKIDFKRFNLDNKSVDPRIW